mgnify:CR=1 FL=1
MAINGTGNIAGPEGAYVQYGTLAQGDTFVFSLEDVNNGAFWLVDNAGYAVGVDGGRQQPPTDQVVLKVTVNATVVA